jgi:hypothetical protein
MLRTSAQQFFYEHFTVLLAISGIFNARVDDFLVNCERIIRVLSKRQLSAQEFIHNDTQRPQIHMETVTLAGNDFRRHVMWSSYNCSGPVPSLDF